MFNRKKSEKGVLLYGVVWRLRSRTSSARCCCSLVLHRVECDGSTWTIRPLSKSKVSRPFMFRHIWREKLSLKRPCYQPVLRSIQAICAVLQSAKTELRFWSRNSRSWKMVDILVKLQWRLTVIRFRRIGRQVGRKSVLLLTSIFLKNWPLSSRQLKIAVGYLELLFLFSLQFLFYYFFPKIFN